ncbi:MAG: hypothetical protein JW919_05445 [Candidatus Omnitrophica bacterium]|nr:hypothetical protein [Candidatus Omnitrophota bacterium]
MDQKRVNNIAAVLNLIGILILLAAAFDIAPVADNVMIFVGIVCFIVGAFLRRLLK